ncbi:MAG: glucose-1-phosphate adenylyltransferase [Oscillospiraceae bacterium]|nr:glucose-1-phosphate adenylyltransferase [Oscillospiraceae bacterium]
MKFQKKRCVAMLLAGGQGSRLLCLTENTAKPAVPFGGKYRIIDFPLSNCVNSGIDTVGILTQYQPLELNEYVGNGAPWGLSRTHGGVQILPPFQRSKRSEWYKGTANAIYQNIPFIDRYDPEDVLILSGDHIYKMDYSEMMEYHKDHGADCTIAVRTVSRSEASRFGIMNCREDGQIYEFEEKPKKPKSQNASMGIYLFRWEILRKHLIADEEDPKSGNDFGKNVIPAMLESGCRMLAYSFNSYWKDVGTIRSLWEANMDVLGSEPAFDLGGRDRVYARNSAMPAAYLAVGSETVNCFITEGAEIYGSVRHSIISNGCTVAKGAEVENSVIMPEVAIGEGAVVKNAIVGENCVIGAGAQVGAAQIMEDDSALQITVIGKNQWIEPGSLVKPGEVL